MRLLVTGGAGFIGSNLVPLLLGRGHEVRVIDDLSASVRPPWWGTGSDLDCRQGSVEDDRAVRRAIRSIDAVVHLAAFGESMQSQPLDPELLEIQDCVAILTAHPQVDYERIVELAPLVFDARGVTGSLVAPNVVRL